MAPGEIPGVRDVGVHIADALHHRLPIAVASLKSKDMRRKAGGTGQSRDLRQFRFAFANAVSLQVTVRRLEDKIDRLAAEQVLGLLFLGCESLD